MVSVNKQPENVIELKNKQKADKNSIRKWSKPVMDQGFTIIPSLLLKAQRRLGLNPTQLAVLMQLADFWWEPERKPYPGKKLLAERLGISERQIQRYLAELEKAGLVKRIERRAAHKGRLTNEYDLSGLVAKLKTIAPEFKKVADETKARRRQVSRPGGLEVIDK